MQSVTRSVVLRGIGASKFRAPIKCQRTFATSKSQRAEGDPAVQPPPKASPDDAPAVRAGESAMIRQQGTSEGQPRHTPDYNVAVDYRTSIFKPTKTATQSGDWHSHHWRMDWDVLGKGHRWENPLMGWQSSADAMQGTHLNFKSKEDAINFAEKQGYEFYVQEPNERRIIPKAYANQFVHSPKKLKHVRTK
ncbi:MAG: hypothetical protein Q9165_005469 [Trypethelium subeluteriae]